MDEYVSVFYILLEESFKIDAGERLEDIQIGSLANASKESYIRKVIKFYEKQAAGPQDPDKPVVRSTFRKIKKT